jgi:hypothetical protein
MGFQRLSAPLWLTGWQAAGQRYQAPPPPSPFPGWSLSQESAYITKREIRLRERHVPSYRGRSPRSPAEAQQQQEGRVLRSEGEVMQQPRTPTGQAPPHHQAREREIYSTSSRATGGSPLPSRSGARVTKPMQTKSHPHLCAQGLYLNMALLNWLHQRPHRLVLQAA